MTERYHFDVSGCDGTTHVEVELSETDAAAVMRVFHAVQEVQPTPSCEPTVSMVLAEVCDYWKHERGNNADPGIAGSELQVSSAAA